MHRVHAGIEVHRVHACELRNGAARGVRSGTKRDHHGMGYSHVHIMM